jgi:hypothetical protein
MSLNKALLYIYLLIFYTTTFPITIMIDPIGDAKYTGREIEDTFERSLTLQCAQKLKEKIEETFPHAQVIITRNAGETLQPLQNTSYANRMNVDLYLCLSFYHQENIPGHISIFYYLENNIDLQHKYKPLHFYHVSQAYLGNVAISSRMAKKLDSVFKQKNINPHFLCLGAFGIPCMPLFGILPPALYIEAGLHRKDDWKYLIQPIIEALKEI